MAIRDWYLQLWLDRLSVQIHCRAPTTARLRWPPKTLLDFPAEAFQNLFGLDKFAIRGSVVRDLDA